MSSKTKKLLLKQSKNPPIVRNLRKMRTEIRARRRMVTARTVPGLTVNAPSPRRMKTAIHALLPITDPMVPVRKDTALTVHRLIQMNLPLRILRRKPHSHPYSEQEPVWLLFTPY